MFDNSWLVDFGVGLVEILSFIYLAIKLAIKFEELENSRRTVKDQISSPLQFIESGPIHPPTIICIINTHFCNFLHHKINDLKPMYKC